jgi:hypothetical protein
MAEEKSTNDKVEEMKKEAAPTTDEKTKLLNLMRYWLFGTFVIVFAAITTYIGLFTDRNALLAVRLGLPIWGITGLVCIIFYVGYSFYVNRKA